MRPLRAIFLILFVIALILPQQYVAGNPLAEEEPESKTCYSLDVIFLVDQSYSMSKEGMATDPNQQREKAVEAMMDWFAFNVTDTCPNATHRVGVISYGTTATVDLGLTTINPASIDEWVVIREKIFEKIVATDLGYTNPVLAFREANKMFDQADDDILEDDYRKKLIVFVTDGTINTGVTPNPGVAAYVEELNDEITQSFPFDSALLARETCLSLVRKAFNEKGIPPDRLVECYESNKVEDSAYRSSVYIYILLMNAPEGELSTRMKDAYAEIAETHAGEVLDIHESLVQKGETPKNGNEIPNFFHNVLEHLSQIETSVRECGPIAVNPFMSRATFTFYKLSPDLKVEIMYSDPIANKVYSITDNQASAEGVFKVIDYQTWGANERYIFENPKPGIWTVKSDFCTTGDTGDISVHYQEATINPGGYALPFKVVPQFDLEPYYDQSDRFYLTYQMMDDKGELIVNEPEPFSVNVTANVTDEQGNAFEYPMEWKADKQSFIATEPLKVQFGGDYHVDIKGTTKIYYAADVKKITADVSVENLGTVLPEVFDTEKVLFEHKDLVFNVREVTPFVLAIDSPQNGERLGQIHSTILKGWKLKIAPIKITAHLALRGEEELPIPISTLLNDPNHAITAQVQYEDGSFAQVSNPDGSTSDFIYLKPSDDPRDKSTFVGSFPGVDTTEGIKVICTLNEDWSLDYRPDTRIEEAKFSRYDSKPWYKPGFYYVILGIIIAYIIFRIICALIIAKNRVVGDIQIVQNGVVKYDRNLAASMKATCIPLRYSIPDKELKSSPELGLKKLSVHYTPLERDGDGNVMPRSIRVGGKCINGDLLDFILEENGVSQPYCSDSSNEICFKNS